MSNLKETVGLTAQNRFTVIGYGEKWHRRACTTQVRLYKFCLAFGLCVASFPLVFASDFSLPESQMKEGLRYFQRGAFEEAATGWTEAARLYEQAGELHEQKEALIFLSQGDQCIGHYTYAFQ